MIVDWPSTILPVGSRACSVSGVADRHDLPRTARIRLIRRTPSSKSPSSTAVMAAISRLPMACPASPGLPARSLVREPVLEDAVHHRLGVGECRDAVADVADWRDPELVAEHAGRAAVIGDGDDRREVARVLLEPRSSVDRPSLRRSPRSGAAGQEALLVDDLDERLAPVIGRNRSRRCPDDHHRADRHAAEADARNHETLAGAGRKLKVRRSISVWLIHPAPVRALPAERIGERQRKEQEAHEDQQHPALDADPRGQPAPQVHVRSSSRWKTATGP